MAPRLVLCHCDPEWTALAVCETCERAELHALLLKRGAVQDNPIVAQAYDALAAAYEPTGSRLEDIWVNGWHQ